MPGTFQSSNPLPKPPKPLFNWTDPTTLSTWMRERQRGFAATLRQNDPKLGRAQSQHVPQWVQSAKGRPQPPNTGRLREAALRQRQQLPVDVHLSGTEAQRLNDVLHSA